MRSINKMLKCSYGVALMLFFSGGCYAQTKQMGSEYLHSLKTELQKTWPESKTINLVFHGHSVPAGYFQTPKVKTLDSYPHLILKKVKERYPTAVINSIVTAIGGEQSEQGAQRFEEEVLSHRPHVLFIDYALNDRSIGLERAKVAWARMIEKALAYGTKVILLTPTPDLEENILSDESPLEKHSQQIRQLASAFGVGLADSYARFKEIAGTEDLESYMAQNNHINDKGHDVVAEEIILLFNQIKD